MRVIFFLGYFFSRRLACLVSNCSWKKSQFIGIKFTVLPFPPKCWNIRKKYPQHVWISIFVKWSVKLSDLPVFRRGNHWETITSKFIAVSYPGSIHPCFKCSCFSSFSFVNVFSIWSLVIVPCFSTLNLRSIPFRSVPFRVLVTTHLTICAFRWFFR